MAKRANLQLLAGILTLTGFGLWCAHAGTGSPAPTLPQPGGPPVDLPGLHNVLRVMDRLWSGSSPEGDAGFESLQKLGVKTILSVDASRPDLARAKKFGMRYVHLPICYQAVPQEQGLRIARAVRDLPGPAYLHCHHGKHRGPAAAAIIWLCLEEQCTVASAVEFMKRAGTDPRYGGLYDSPRKLRRPTPADLDRVSASFPEAALVSRLAQAMVEIDEHWDHLQLVKKAGWRTPKQHPDLDPANEAAILRQHFDALAQAPGSKPAAQLWFEEARANAQRLEELFRRQKSTPVQASDFEAVLVRMGMDCTRCHAKYRDPPHPSS